FGPHLAVLNLLVQGRRRRNAMRTTTFLVLLICGVSCMEVGCSRDSGTTARDPALATSPSPESRYAREVAETFLRAAGDGLYTEQAKLWFSENFQQRIDSRKRLISWNYYEYKGWSISSVAMAPDQDEAIIRGSVQATKRRWGSATTGSSSGGGTFEWEPF